MAHVDGLQQVRASLGDGWVSRIRDILQDPEQAASLSNEQMQDCHYALGWALLTGSDVERDEALGEKHLHTASSAGHTSAKALLGGMLLQRENVRDAQRGYDLTAEAARAGDGQAQFNLSVALEQGRPVRKGKNESRRWLLAAAESGFPAAQYSLGCELLEEPQGKHEEARSWLDKACEQDYAPALFKLGSLYLIERTTNGKDNQEKSNALIQRAAEAGDVRAQWAIGAWSTTGACGFTKDAGQAAAWFAKGASSPKGTLGRAGCLDGLADAYLYGTGLNRDPQKAVELFKEAAEEGSGAAAFTLYEYRRDGTHLGKDIDEAIRWCRKAAENGYDRAVQLFDAGEFQGRTPADVTREVSFHWLERAAPRSVSSSTHYRLGLRYWNGDGIGKDDATAVAWFRHAASNDSFGASVEAAHALGTAYETGRGVRRRDTASALRWYKRAVELGMSAANGDITRMMEAGVNMVDHVTDSERPPAEPAEQPRRPMNEPKRLAFSSTLPWFLGACIAVLFLLAAGWPLVVLGLALGAWTLAGFRTIPLGHVGVPLLFGARQDSWVLSEGLQWIPAGAMGHVNVDVRIKSTTVPSIQAITRDGVPLRPTAVMSYGVADPALYLGAGANVESTGLPEAVGRNIIGFIKGRSIGDALALQGNDLPSVRTAVGNTLAQWGLRLDGIQMTNMTPPPEVVAEMQRKYQMEQVVGQTELIRKGLNLSSQQAAEFGQVERQTLRKQVNEVRISGDDSLVEILKALIRR